jgi:GT2 family glycosyltransferase
VVRLPGATVPELRAAALRAATGDVLAIVDPDCRLDAGWLATARAAMRHAPAICGPVEYDGRSLTAWAAFLAEYGAFLPPSSARAGVAGTNLVVRRSALEAIGAFDGPFWKDEIVDRLRASGVRPYYLPNLLVHHRRPWRPSEFAVDRFHQGRCYAARRRRPAAERLARAKVWLLISLLLFGRLASSYWSKRRSHVAFLVASPVVFVFLMAWALGEAIGYLLGAGDSCRRC